MFRGILILTFSFSLLLNSCIEGPKHNYSLPSNVSLSEYTLYNPFFIDQLNETPFQFGNIWNDSLLKTAGINRIKFITKGLKNPEDTSELIQFSFNEKFELSTFNFTQFEVSKTPICQASFNGNNGKLNRYFGENVNQKLERKHEKTRVLQLRERKNGIWDTTFIYGSLDRPTAIIEKSGTFISHINLIIKEGEALNRTKEILASLSIEMSDLLNAEKNVTYVDQNYRPQRTYLIDESFVQTNLVAEWEYENNKKLVGFKKFVNLSPIKEYSFNYTDDKLLRSFEFNRVKFTVEYN
jgi:hypothetical protein